jgi:hypothetical protein
MLETSIVYQNIDPSTAPLESNGGEFPHRCRVAEIGRKKLRADLSREIRGGCFDVVQENPRLRTRKRFGDRPSYPASCPGNQDCSSSKIHD